MKALVTDKIALNNVSPNNLKTYLRSKDWIEEFEISTNVNLWRNGAEEVIVLDKDDFNDYALRVSETLRTLEKKEARSQLQIIRDIYTSAYDIIRIRNKSEDAQDGSIPYDMGLEFNAGAKDLIQAVACSVASPKPYYLTRKPQKSQDFMKKIRLGQTEQGSYILTVLNPILPLQQGEQFELIPLAPYERKVTATLSAALTKANIAAQSFRDTGNYSDFIEGINYGLSANLFDSIVRIAATSPGQDIDLNITWSRNRPAPQDIETDITVSSGVISIFSNVSSILKEREPETEYNMRGVVIRLQKEKSTGNGKVTVLDISSGVPRKITLELSGQQYDTAIEAHKKYKTIQCIGEIARRGRSYILINQGKLDILEDLELTDTKI